MLKDQVVCIEEPELHMHPTLQKKLIEYLYSNTTNQYFISTHSAHILDHPKASIFHVRFEDGSSKVTPVYTDVQKFTVCTDLGYRASDLLQANCIVWVEGPSDRIYLNHWIKSVDSSLVEGIHYSIMFYGGRLLKHLSVNDPEIDEFISLRRLNRNLSIVIDSDRTAKTKKINKTKQRIRSEFSSNNGIVWVTSGREIENYIPHDTLEYAVKEVHPSVKSLKKFGQFDDALHAITSKEKFNTVDKVKIAHEVTGKEIDWGVLDLQTNVENLVAFIKSSNGADA